MSETSEHDQPSKRVTIGYLLLFLLFLVLAFLLWQWWQVGQDRLLKPAILLETPSATEVDGQPIPVSFADLQEMPTSYQGFRIQVTGNFTRIAPPDCFSFNGPIIQWGLINNELQMNGIGMESILHLVPEGTTLTVEGIWRLYRGPVGCGKEPEPASVWYLSIERILQPNPLPAFGTPFALTPLPVEDGTAIPTETAVSPNDPSTTTIPPNATAVATPTRLPTIGAIDLTMTVTATETAILSSTSTPTSAGTAVSTLTPPPNSTATVTPTASSTPTIDPAATPTSGSNLPPPASTATPQDGYLPPPTSSATPTSSSSYP